jgi:signal transduction histidine kinase
MTGHLWLDWAMLAVSLFNTLLLLWLGMTVFLNAERRTWGIWLASGGLLLGAIFFTSHTAILGQGVSVITPGLNFWWRIGWIPVAALPFIWYLVMLWYAGFWDRPIGGQVGRGALRRRQRGWFALATLSGLVLLALLGFANPLPSLNNLAGSRLSAAPSIAGLPALILAYPLYTWLCMGLSIDALRRPGGSGRLMGELARARARRWLMTASLVLLGVSLLVGWVMIWIVENAWRGVFQPDLMMTVGWFDLAIAGLIAVSVLLLGQAVVAYEVFTGKTLPRRGLAQYWRRAVILAAGFSLLASGGLTLGLRPVYTLLLSAVVMITFLALLGWRAFAHRQRLIENLRPFAASQRFIDSLLGDDTPVGHSGDGELYAPFQALCVNVLEASRAGLFPYGPLALLAGPAWFYPPESPFSPPDLDAIASRLREGPGIGLELSPGEAAGTLFAVPLWRESGLGGMILLGPKQGGGPYTQEEIEIAQATGERLVDARASTEMARRLVALQRQRLAAGQVLDQRLRRQVHDEVLPLVHTAMLEMVAGREGDGSHESALSLLEEIHRRLSDLLQSMPTPTTPEVARAGLVGALRRTVSDELEDAFDEVSWQVEPQAEALAGELPPLIAEVIYSAMREGIRNAARHGRGGDRQSRLCLSIAVEVDRTGRLGLTLEDNGVGIGERGGGEGQEAGRSVPGGSGQGLALHSTLMAVIGGSLSVSSRPGQYTRLRLELPTEAWAGEE